LPVDENMSFEELGIEEGGRISVQQFEIKSAEPQSITITSPAGPRDEYGDGQAEWRSGEDVALVWSSTGSVGNVVIWPGPWVMPMRPCVQSALASYRYRCPYLSFNAH